MSRETERTAEGFAGDTQVHIGTAVERAIACVLGDRENTGHAGSIQEKLRDIVLEPEHEEGGAESDAVDEMEAYLLGEEYLPQDQANAVLTLMKMQRVFAEIAEDTAQQIVSPSSERRLDPDMQPAALQQLGTLLKAAPAERPGARASLDRELSELDLPRSAPAIRVDSEKETRLQTLRRKLTSSGLSRKAIQGVDREMSVARLLATSEAVLRYDEAASLTESRAATER